MEARTSAFPNHHTLEPSFPESDGQPMGESGLHVATILYLIGALKAFFRRRRDVLVSGNQFMYWESDDPGQVACPDVYLVFGVAPEPRRTIKTWVEGKAPDVIFEITSRKTKSEDTRTKQVLYEELGVGEYFLFDPENDYLRPPLQGYRLIESRYQPIGGETLHSELMGVDLRIVNDTLRLFDSATGEMLLDTPESAERIEEQAKQIKHKDEEIERLQAEIKSLRESRSK